jgi:hypothetical protein
LLKNLKGRDHSVDRSVDGRIVIEWIWVNRVEVVDWIHLAQSMDQCRALANMVVHFWVP